MWNTITGAGRKAGMNAFSTAMGWAGKESSRAALHGAGFYGASVARGAATGAAIGGATAIPDKDRGFISGTLAGAFWGAAAGAGGRGLTGAFGAKGMRFMQEGARHARAAGHMSPDHISRGLGGARASLRGIRQGQGGAAVVTGAFGTGAWLFGGSRRRKQYSRYGRSQSGPQQNQGSYGGGRRY